MKKPAAIKCPNCRAVGSIQIDWARFSTCHQCSGIGWLRSLAR